MTFPTGEVVIRKCSDEELKTMLDDAREASKYSRKLGRVLGIVAARRLQQMKDLLTFEKLATWTRMNDFDRVADGEDNWFHGPHSLPPTPEEFIESLWCKVNELKNAISMPATTRLWRKTMDFVDGLKGKLSGEKLAVRVFQRLGGGGGDTTISSPGMSPKQPLPGIGSYMIPYIVGKLAPNSTHFARGLVK